MANFDRVGILDPTKTYLSDTTQTLGAPDMPGAIRWRVHPSGPKYGLQGYRCLLNETDGTVATAIGVVMGEAETAGLGMNASALWGAALTTPLNLLGGVTCASVLDNYWFWAQVYGLATVTDVGGTVDGAKIETAASGQITDTVGTGVIVGFACATITNATGSAFLTIVQPR